MVNEARANITEIQKSVTLVLQISSVGAIIFNLWIFTKLAPIVQDLALLSQRVNASETKLDGFVPRELYESDRKHFEETLNDIKSSQKTILTELRQK